MIYQNAAPKLEEVPGDAADEFAFQDMMTGLVEEIINKYDGQLISHSTTKKVNWNIVLGKKAPQMVSFFA
ncbi:hypothetical protein J6TS2_30900 [Heyndrickxia sporothermodurans]|nr:hypothetical protein J6TS2_30900 [Heyndrickxia sporothermodurans]